jgi:hypothetical protein
MHEDSSPGASTYFSGEQARSTGSNWSIRKRGLVYHERQMNPAPVDDLARARDVAVRYGCEFVDLHNFKLKSDLVKKLPARLMLRYNFVPLTEMQDERLAVAIADPSQLMMIDEISLLLGKRLVVHVASLAQINEILGTLDESAAPTADPSPDEPIGPTRPDAPVRAPLKPKPHLRSGAARAVPEHEQ